jgi:membrane fusion protein, multidrug efflux system
MKKFWSIAIIIIVIIAVAFKLKYNKKQIEANSKLDANTQIIIPVKTFKAQVVQYENKINVSGIFSSWSEVTVMSESQGKVIKFLFETGKYVKEGETLAILDDDLIKSQLVLAEASYQKSQHDFSKYSGLAANDAVSSQQLEEIKLAQKNAQTNLIQIRKQLDNTTIKAPFSGIITKRYVERGTLVLPGMSIAEITEMSRVKFNARVAESDINSITPGMEVFLDVPAIGRENLKGKVYTIQAKSDEARRYSIDVEVSNPGNLIKPGMFGTAQMKVSQKGVQGIYIPRDCLNGSIKEPEVFIVKNNIAIRKSIKIGKITDDNVEVIAGISPGDFVVQSGQINLEDSTKVNSIE